MRGYLIPNAGAIHSGDYTFYYGGLTEQTPTTGRRFAGFVNSGIAAVWPFVLHEPTTPVVIPDKFRAYDGSLNVSRLRSWRFDAGIDFSYEDPEPPDLPPVEYAGVVFRGLVYSGAFAVRSWDYYDRYSSGPGDDPPPPPDYTFVSERKYKPVYCSAGAFMFFTKPDRSLWKFDGDYVYPLGLAGEEEFLTHKINVNKTKKINRCYRVNTSKPVETGHTNEIQVDVDMETCWKDFGDSHYPAVPEVLTDPNIVVFLNRLHEHIMWILGFPFMIVGHAKQTGWVYRLYLRNLDAASTSCTHSTLVLTADNRHTFPHDGFQDCGYPSEGLMPDDVFYNGQSGYCVNAVVTDEWGVMGYHAATLFNPDGSSSYFLDNHSDGDEPSRLKGSYEWVYTLVTKHGYESNWCGPASTTLDKTLPILTLDYFSKDLLFTPDIWGEYLKYSSDYIKEVRIYRSYADRPGAYYLVGAMPYGYHAYDSQEWTLIGSQGRNTYASFFFDYSPDEELGEALHPWKLVPKIADSMASVKSTLAVADSTGLYISEVGDPETFYFYQTFEEEIVAVAAIPYFDEFIVFLRSKIYKINIFDKSIQLVSSGIGLAGKDAFCVLSDRIIFMAPGGGLYHYAGGVPQLIPGFEKLAPVMYGSSRKRSVNRIEFSNTFMMYSVKDHQVWVILGEGRTYGNLALVIHLNKPVFCLYKFPFQIMAGASFPNVGDESIILADSQGNVYSFGEWGDDDDGISIPLMLESPEMGDVDQELRLRRLYLEVQSTKADVQFEVTGNYDRDGYENEGLIQIRQNGKGFEGHVNCFSKVVPTYQFKIREESGNQYVIKRITLLLQPKKERVRNHR